jgi:hypothetical protein
MQFCNDIRRDYPECPECCISCHEDAEDGWYELCGDYVNYIVCCSVSLFLDSIGVDIYK